MHGPRPVEGVAENPRKDHAPTPLEGKPLLWIDNLVLQTIGFYMSHSPDDPDADRRALQLRLRKITGQLKGVESMIQGDYECAEVLNQIVSARQALKSLAEKLLNDHLEHHLSGPASPEQRKKQLREITTMLRRYVE